MRHMKYILPLSFLLALVATDKEASDRLIGGHLAKPGQFSYQLYLLAENRISCGGSLLSNLWVLTAAHCVYKFNHFQIYAGFTSMKTISSANVRKSYQRYCYPWYPVQKAHDIALVRLHMPMYFNDRIQPIHLIDFWTKDTSFINEELTICGWRNGQLHWVALKVISNQECRRSYPFLANINLCCQISTEGTVCFGDSGGPLVHWWDAHPVQVGIASFVGSKGCTSGTPAGFVRVGPYLSWIENIISSY